ncbi:MAG: hypothetical protein L0G49_14010 [Luteococcus sp.]|uniref:hypothetical protein n=1 Tax=Luteococcus sp. TaxID=1969402 RepID=UPI0026492A28|nr:hypothetical protein [Luteococcus sp.]MDN5564852.1 hypothetical protein [Luteococcus sp.]
MWLSTQEARRRLAADDPCDFARRAARDFLAGRTSGQRFLADLHLIGHQGPEGLQDLVELDDQYLFGNDPGAEERFMKDRGDGSPGEEGT